MFRHVHVFAILRDDLFVRYGIRIRALISRCAVRVLLICRGIRVLLICCGICVLLFCRAVGIFSALRIILVRRICIGSRIGHILIFAPL